MQAEGKPYSRKERQTILWMLKRANYNALLLEECEKPFIATVTQMSLGTYLF